ncbi:MAG: dipeptide epimerase [Alphaproteobacteria bacterium]
MKRPFTISRGTRTHAETLIVTLTGVDGVIGRGECTPYARYGETLDSVEAEIEGLRDWLRSEGADRQALQQVLPAGAARNALDCALWDLEAKRSSVPLWMQAGLAGPPLPVQTVYTLSLDTPQEMAAQAVEMQDYPVLKLKLGGGDEDAARISAIRAVRPDASLIVDANEGWAFAEMTRLLPDLAKAGVDMVEQPLHADQDERLAGFDSPILLCADESCHDRTSLPKLKGQYEMVNLKLDKTGGLTEALALKSQAEAEGYRIMVGCMVASSLAMAPAQLLAQGADIVDLDAPLLLAEDQAHPLPFDGAYALPPPPELWG